MRRSHKANPNRPPCPCGRPVRRSGAIMCATCWSDPAVRQRIVYARSKQRGLEAVERSAERETASLPARDAYNPLVGERLVRQMQRGEW